jgi:hypothetical protein
MAEAINEDLAKEEYFEAATLKSVADIRKHVTGAKVELPTSLRGLVRVLNNYCRLLEVLFGPDCPHLAHVLSIKDALEAHEADLELQLMGAPILHLMWCLHYDARQFFLACKCWDDKESLSCSALGLTVRQLVDDCSIQSTLTCPEALFMGPPTSCEMHQCQPPPGRDSRRAAAHFQCFDPFTLPEGSCVIQPAIPGIEGPGLMLAGKGIICPT